MSEIIEQTKDNKRKELEEKIRIYKKNNKALCDMLVLCLYIFKNNHLIYYKYSNDVIFYQLAETFLKDLEDSEVKVLLVANSIENLIKNDEKEYDSIRKQIKENSYVDLEYEFLYKYSKKTFDIKLEYDHSYNSKYEGPFNFIRLLCRNSLDWTREYLISDIDISTRMKFLSEIILMQSSFSNSTNNFKYLLSDDKGFEFGRTDVEVQKEKINELITELNKKVTSKDKYELLMKIIKNNKDNYLMWIMYLQEKQIIDFTDLIVRFDSDDNELNYSSSVCLLNNKRVDSFKKFYELADYLKIPSEIRDNDDTYFIRNINVYEISKLISLSNFRINEKNIVLISERIQELKNDNEYYSSSCPESVKVAIEKTCLEIENAIIHKAKNKKEYKMMLEFVEIFKKRCNYEYEQETELVKKRVRYINFSE